MVIKSGRIKNLPNTPKPNIYIISLGCPRNLVDTEVLEGALKKKGFRISDGPKKGSVAVVNTCGFIEDAKAESIDIILELAELKKTRKIARLIVTGCLSQRYSRNLTEEIPEIDGIFGTGNFDRIPESIEAVVKGEKPNLIDEIPHFLYNHRMPRSRITPRHSVYVKIQEGCMNFCSYCVIPEIRGPYRSRSADSVLKEIALFKKRNAKEINLIGQDTTLYAVDRYGHPALDGLLVKAAKIMKSGWIRLLYTHPAHYTENLINTIRDEPSVCKYLDLPIQHINDRILKRMNRRLTKKNIISLIEKLRRKIPNLAIRTSLIVGFPGESDKDFCELEEYIKEARFERLGVFAYSREEGTRAFDFPRQVPDSEKHRRLKRIMQAQKKISEGHNRRHLGKRVKVLIDAKDASGPGQYMGRTEHDAPEVDGGVYVRSKKPLSAGDFIDVRIEDTLEYDLVGSAV